jgi:hypothetical protein
MCLKLRVADPKLPFDLWVELDDSYDGATAGGVILSQGQKEGWRPITMVGRDLTEAERKLTAPE